MLSVKIGGFCLEVPQLYEELTQEQALYALGIRSAKTPLLIQQCLFLNLLLVGSPSVKYWWQRWYIKFCLRRLSDDSLYNLFALTKFFFEPITTTRPLLPHFTLQGITYYAPADKLKNCSFIEFIRSEDAYRNYYQTQQVSYLYELAAILYRPAASTPSLEDVREPFNDYCTPQRKVIFQGLHDWQLHAIVLFFQNSLAHIRKQYASLYDTEEEQEEDEEIIQHDKPAQSPLLQWFSVIRQLAEHPTHFEATAKLNLYAVLFELVERQKEYKEYQRKQPTDFDKPLYAE